LSEDAPSPYVLEVSAKIDRQGKVHFFTVTNEADNFGVVYRAMHRIKDEIERQIAGNDRCPFHPANLPKIEAELSVSDNARALARWKAEGGVRPAKRPDGWPTRSDIEWFSPAELSIRETMLAIENAGASVALTDAVILLAQARARVADHVEGVLPRKPDGA
jgi:hypothetical protein